MAMNDHLCVEVVYATPKDQCVVKVDVLSGTTIEAAIRASDLLERFPEIDLSKQAVGVFGKACSLDVLVSEGDRIEIYRPLIIDPKEARRAKAKMTRKG